MSVTITPSIIAVQMTSTLQSVSISVNNPSVVVSLASGEYLPTDPNFNSITVTTDATIGRDVDAGRDVNATGDVNAGNNITCGEVFNCRESHTGETLYTYDSVNYGDAQINGNITTVNSIQFDPNPTNAPDTTGNLHYNSEDRSLELSVGNGVTLTYNEEIPVDLVNRNGVDIANGKLVYISGSHGNRATAGFATNATCASASKCIAMATETVTNTSRGKFTSMGRVKGLNTQGIAEGSELWLGTNGDWISTRPAVGTARVSVGIVLKEHPTDGWVFVWIRQDKYMFGDRDNGNYSVFEDDGTLIHYGNAVVHEDLNFDVLNSGGPASNVPDNVRIGNNDYREFTSANNQSCSANKENFHAAQLGQSFIPHAHIFLKNGESIGTTGVTFTVYWELRQSTGVTNGSIVLSATSAQLQANPYKLDLYNGGSFTGPTELGAQLNLRLARTGGNAGDVIATTYGVHVALDAGGSRTATSK